MGYRFTIKHSNLIAHLIEGNIITFTNELMVSPENFVPTIDSLNEILKSFGKDFYSDRNYQEEVNSLIEHSQYRLEELRSSNIFDRISPLSESQISKLGDIFYPIHRIMSRARIKTLLLPGFEQDEMNNAFTSEYLLRELLYIHPGESCLILQLKEKLERKEIYLFNAFKSFEKLSINIDNFPGVLIWDNYYSEFLPIQSLNQLYDTYRLIEEHISVQKLRDLIGTPDDKNRYKYFFHLSDLHFGHKLSTQRKTRLINLVVRKQRDLECENNSYPIITGDLLDSPTNENKDLYDDFKQQIQKIFNNEPIAVLGNHDYDQGGILKRLTKEKSIINVLSESSPLVKIDKLNLIIIKFNSNSGGNLAQGLIGDQQFQLIGNELDKINNINDYSLIAILHHHPLKILKPDWYSREWYERILGDFHEQTMKLLDADKFLEWIKQRKINFVLHGHKHIPVFNSHNEINVVGAGSSTGIVRHKDKNKMYLSFNIFKYDKINKKIISGSIFYEDLIGSGIKHFATKLFL